MNGILIDNKNSGNFEYRIYKGDPKWDIQIIDDKIFAQPYIKDFTIVSTPMLEVKKISESYCLYAELLRWAKYLWKTAETKDQFYKRLKKNS